MSKRRGPRTSDRVAAMMYGAVEPLDIEKHRDLRIMPQGDYLFAIETHLLPLAVVEFTAASRHYPIVFSHDDVPGPVAMLGVTRRHNLFVEEDGSWADGCYVPAFVRRYPFILLRPEAGEEVQLCLDRESDRINFDHGDPLYDGEDPSAFQKQVRSFNTTYAREQARTRQFALACMEHDLFVERTVEYPLPEDRKLQMSGFLVIDTERFQRLPDDVVLNWWRKGYMPMAYAHIFSLGNFGRLIHRAQRQAERAVEEMDLD